MLDAGIIIIISLSLTTAGHRPLQVHATEICFQPLASSSYQPSCTNYQSTVICRNAFSNFREEPMADLMTIIIIMHHNHTNQESWGQFVTSTTITVLIYNTTIL
ncbi:unnamed protein product [Chrysodeixis includens]|uniref:Secreted protein n=1 Tax=Chrysodeixis includens TaxID=689277 RepID=A0A9P0BNP6_CHRIL|nr:unnamed protein product [Chrysodeixis includens]